MQNSKLNLLIYHQLSDLLESANTPEKGKTEKFISPEFSIYLIDHTDHFLIQIRESSKGIYFEDLLKLSALIYQDPEQIIYIDSDIIEFSTNFLYNHRMQIQTKFPNLVLESSQTDLFLEILIIDELS